MPKDYGTHPAWGWVQVSRLYGSPGRPLFDSELLHHEVVELRISGAKRARDLNRDWVMSDGDEHTIVRMSMAQWGALVSSFGSSGVPTTIARKNGEAVEQIEYEPRMTESLNEINGATDKLLRDIESAVESLNEAFTDKAGRKVLAERLRSLNIQLGNARSNARFVAKSFTEHVETTITKARADVEAMVQTASRAGLEVGAGDVLGLPSADDVIDVEED